MGDTSAVGNYPSGASPYGALDMAGKVWAWVNDWFSETYYSQSPASAPQGPSSGDYRVLRGGSWNDVGFNILASHRYNANPSVSYLNFGYVIIGFRCSRSSP